MSYINESFAGLEDAIQRNGAEMKRLRESNAELLEALKAVEFGNAVTQHKCVYCHGWNVGPNGETPRVHTSECLVARAIAKAEVAP